MSTSTSVNLFIYIQIIQEKAEKGETEEKTEGENKQEIIR